MYSTAGIASQAPRIFMGFPPPQTETDGPPPAATPRGLWRQLRHHKPALFGPPVAACHRPVSGARPRNPPENAGRAPGHRATPAVRSATPRVAGPLGPGHMAILVTGRREWAGLRLPTFLPPCLPPSRPPTN